MRSNPYGVSAYWGDKPYWEPHAQPQPDDGRARPHLVHLAHQPGSESRLVQGRRSSVGEGVPLTGNANRHLSYYEPRTNTWTLIRTCFPTHHLNFGKDNVLWTSPGVVGPNVIGWFDRKVFEQSNDERRAQGWTPFIVDTNGDGKRGEWVAHDQPLDPKKDKQLRINHYSVAVSPADGTIWGDGARLPGRDHPRGAGRNRADRAHRDLRAAAARLRAARRRHRRGGRVLGGALERAPGRVRPQEVPGDERPERHRQALPRGLDAAPVPGPQLRDVRTRAAETSYYVWVDLFGILGLGKNIPIAMGNGSDSIMPFVNGSSSCCGCRIRRGSFRRTSTGGSTTSARDGRERLVDDFGVGTNFHLEGGKENRPKAIKLQLRPDPLAR